MNVLVHAAGDDGSLPAALRERLPGMTISTREACDPDAISDAVVWLPPPDFFDGLTALRRVHLVAAGVDHLLAHPGLPRDATVLRLEDAGMGREMAEYVLYGVLHAQRRFAEFAAASREGRWARDVTVRSAGETRVGILGAGVLGLSVARRLVTNGYRVSCWSRTTKRLPEGVSGAVGDAARAAFLSASDVLVCLLPLTDATRGILDADTFSRLPPGAFLINVARGGHLIEADLVEALDAGRVSGALLDVFEQEPLPSAHPFHRDPRIIVTPHVAAPSPVDASVEQIATNLEAASRGAPLRGVIDRSRGY